MRFIFGVGGMAAKLGRAALRLASLFLFILGGLYLFQDRLLYFPDTAPLGEVAAAAKRQGLTPWPSEDDYRGLLWEPRGAAGGTLLLFHGNAGQAIHRAWLAEELGRFGLRVILLEYPAYGPRGGELGEDALVADGRASLALARRRFPGPLYVAGESLGAGVAAAVAGASGDISGILLITPWDKLAHVARYHYPWVPVGLLLRDRYDSVANLAAFPGPVAVVVAAEDRTVPAEFGRALFEGLHGRKQMWTVPGSDHNDWPLAVDEAWWRQVVGFLAGDGRSPG